MSIFIIALITFGLGLLTGYVIWGRDSGPESTGGSNSGNDNIGLN